MKIDERYGEVGMQKYQVVFERALSLTNIKTVDILVPAKKRGQRRNTWDRQRSPYCVRILLEDRWG